MGFGWVNRATSGLFEISTTEIAKGRPPFIFIERGPPIFPYDFASSAVSAVKEAANRAASWPSCPAKDVAAFANANGGYIFIGLATKPAVLRVGEEGVGTETHRQDTV